MRCMVMPGALRWCPCSGPCCQAVTTTEEGQLVMFGGVDSLEQNTRTDKVFTAWLTIPTLRALAWEAVTFYNPDLDR